jgi:hypothetical protein
VDVHQPAVVEADEDEIVYKITFDLLDTGLPAEGQSKLQMPLSNDQDDTMIAPLVPVDTDAPEAPSQRYPTQTCRSAVSSQPYNQFSPRLGLSPAGDNTSARKYNGGKSTRKSAKRRANTGDYFLELGETLNR